MDKEKLFEQLQECDMVLVGIGTEFMAEAAIAEEETEYQVLLSAISNEEKLAWMNPFIQRILMEKYAFTKVKKAYQVLEAILEGKNYFIVSVCTDDMIYHIFKSHGRIVTPCGGYQMLQCKNNCSGQLTPADELFAELRIGLSDIEMLQRIQTPMCKNCGSELVFNRIQNEVYAEEGYLEQWNQYKKWLQGTVNRKLCVMELGVSMIYPTVIRWPFEKIAYYNQKSSFYRINSKLYQLTEELKEKGISIPCNPIDFLIN